MGRGLGVSPTLQRHLYYINIAIKYALTETLAETQGTVVLGLARNEAAVENHMRSDGFNALILEADITDQAALTSAAETAEKSLEDKGIDVIINNAGYVSEITTLKSLQDL